jgi:hypothetical protein
MSRVSIRGTLTDACNETIRTQDEALDSTLWPYVHAAIDGCSLEDGHGKRDRKQAPVPSFFLQPSPPNIPGRVRTRETRMERLIGTPSKTSKVSATDISTLHGDRPSTGRGSFLGTSWASIDYIPTTLPDLSPYRTSMRPQNQRKMARGAECRGTRNHN